MISVDSELLLPNLLESLIVVSQFTSVDPESHSIFWNKITTKLIDAMKPMSDSIEIRNLLSILDKFEERKWCMYQDIRNRKQNEWRWLPNDIDKELKFTPKDIAYLLVDSNELAYNLIEEMKTEPKLLKYYKSQVPVIPVDSLITSMGYDKYERSALSPSI